VSQTLTAVPERTSQVVTFELRDQGGVLIADANLLTLTLTLSDLRTNQILNARLKTNIKNANGWTVATGAVSGILTDLDNVMLDLALAEDRHLATVEWTYLSAGNTFRGAEEILVPVSRHAAR